MRKPRFTKQHYLILAEALKESRPPMVDYNSDKWAVQVVEVVSDRQWQKDITYICKALHADNPAFDEAYFQSTISGLTKGTNRARGT